MLLFLPIFGIVDVFPLVAGIHLENTILHPLMVGPPRFELGSPAPEAGRIGQATPRPPGVKGICKAYKDYGEF